MADALGGKLPADPADIIKTGAAQDVEFIAQFLQHVLILPRHLDTGRRGAHACGDYLWQGNQVFVWTSARKDEIFLAVSQLLNAVEYACCQFFAAYRADSVVLSGLGGAQAEVAFAVAVKVILAFFREELNGSGQSFASLDGAVKPVIGHGDVKEVGFPSKLGRRVGIGIGNQMKGIQG